MYIHTHTYTHLYTHSHPHTNTTTHLATPTHSHTHTYVPLPACVSPVKHLMHCSHTVPAKRHDIPTSHDSIVHARVTGKTLEQDTVTWQDGVTVSGVSINDIGNKFDFLGVALNDIGNKFD